MKQVYRVPSYKFKQNFKVSSQSSACSLDCCKKEKEKEKMKKERERKSNRKMQGIHWCSGEEPLPSRFLSPRLQIEFEDFPWQGLNCSCSEKYTLFLAKTSGFLEFHLKGLGL